MSDKEKRILIVEVNPDCKALKFDNDPFDEEDVVYCDKNGRWERIKTKDCKECRKGFSRAEAVGQIKSAFCKNCKGQDKSCFDCGVSKEGCEAALDVLLSKEARNAIH